MTDNTTPPDLPPLPNLPFVHEPIDWPALWCEPDIAPGTWIAPGAVVVGRVRIGRRCSVWHHCVIRGDGQFIELGDDCNIQDGSVLHIDADTPCRLGPRVSLGHRAIVHASTLDEEVLIGMNATVLSRCHIGSQAIVAAGAVVLEGTQIPGGTIWAGCPARQIGEVSAAHKRRIRHTWQHYVNMTAAMLARDAAGKTDSA